MRADWSVARSLRAPASVPSSFLMLDWTGSWLTVTEVSREGATTRIGRTFKQAISTDDMQGQATASAWLIQLIKRERLTARQAIVCAPRRYVAFKLLTLPAVSDDRLAEAVHLQCETIFPVAMSELAVDFVAQPLAAEQTERAVLVAAIPKEHVQRIQDCLVAADLECHAILVPELAMARNEVTTEVDAEAIVLLGPAKIEFTIRARSMPILCFAAKAPSEANMPGEIISTLRRLLASVPSTSLARPLSSIRFLQVMATDSPPQTAAIQPAWVDQLRRELLIQVSYRFVKREEEMKAESLVSALTDPQCRINFAAPRKPIDHRRLVVQKRLKVACVIAAVAFSGWTLARLNTWRLESRIASLQRQRLELEQQIEKERPRWQQVAMVAKWQDKQLDYSRWLSTYIAALPGAEDLMLLRIEALQNGDGNSELNVEGLAKNSQCVNTLVNALIDNPQYSKTQLKRLEARQGDNRYSAEFAITVILSGGQHAEN